MEITLTLPRVEASLLREQQGSHTEQQSATAHNVSALYQRRTYLQDEELLFSIPTKGIPSGAGLHK